MTVQFNSNYTLRGYTINWAGWKTARTAKSGIHQHTESDSKYDIYFYDGPEVHLCEIWRTELPAGIVVSGYTQEQNDADKADFEANFKPTSNKSLAKMAADGRNMIVTTTAKVKTAFRLRIFSFIPGQPDSLHAKNAYGTVLTDVSMTCYKADGTTTTDAALAVKSVIDFAPSYGYEVIGGWIDFPPAIIGGNTNEWYISTAALPDIPAPYGTFTFTDEADLECVYGNKVVSDGRATMYLPPGATKIRWTLKHPVSTTAKFQLYVETFD